MKSKQGNQESCKGFVGMFWRQRTGRDKSQKKRHRWQYLITNKQINAITKKCHFSNYPNDSDCFNDDIQCFKGCEEKVGTLKTQWGRVSNFRLLVMGILIKNLKLHIL